jgi:voltage-gated potassium channel
MNNEAIPSLTSPQRRRHVTLGLLRGLAVTIALTLVYYVLPLDRLADTPLWTVVVTVLVVLAAVTFYQVRAVLLAAAPGIRAIQALAVIVPIFLLLFAATYFVASEANPDTFNVSELTRTDALYFTVSTFASVGFGDIVATTESSRALVTVQMILNLIVLGAVVRILISAVQRARRSATGNPHPS